MATRTESANPVAMIGVTFWYTTTDPAQTSPTPATFTQIPDVTNFEAPDAIEPETIDTTSYSATKYRTSITGLIDTSDVQTIEANSTSGFRTAWRNMVTASDSGTVWLCVDVPGIESLYCFPIIPLPLGMPSGAPGERAVTNARFTISGDAKALDIIPS